MRLAVVLVTTSVGLGLFAPVPARASCAGPSISIVEPRVLRAGEGVAVEGVGFTLFGECDDTGTSGGCAPRQSPRTPTPARAVPLVLLQGTRVWQLGTADPSGPTYHWAFRVPADVAPGAATLAAGTATQPVRVKR